MWLKNILWCNLWWQNARILNFYAVIIDGNAYGQVISFILTMAKGIQYHFTQSFGRYFQIFISYQSNNFPMHVQVLAEEVHSLIEQHEDVSFHSLVVDKLILISSLETGQAHCELGVHACIFCKECCGCVQRFATCRQLPFP